MMTLPVPVTATPLRTPVPSPTGVVDDGRFADALATHLAQRGASPQTHTDGARNHTAATGEDGPRPARTDGERRTDRSTGSERPDRAPDRIGERDRTEARPAGDDTAAEDAAAADATDTRRTESERDVENRTSTDGADDRTDDAASAPADETEEPTGAVATTAVPVAIDAEARVAVLALGTLIAEAAPTTPSAAAGRAAATGDEHTMARTLVEAVGTPTVDVTPTGTNMASPASTTTTAAAANAATAATATGTDGDPAVVPAPVLVADGEAPQVSAPLQSTPVGTAANVSSTLTAALDAATTEAGEQAGTSTTTTTARTADQQGQQSSTTTQAPTTTVSPLGTTANPAVAVAAVPTPATSAASTAAAPTAVSTTTVDGSVATAASTTQAFSNPGVARGELTAPQRLAAVIAPEAGRMRGTVGHRTLEIRLDPPDLGTVDLEIRSSGSTVTVVARTESAEAMLAVLRQRDSIEASLRDLGMELSGFDVSAGTPDREQTENRRGADAAGTGTRSSADTGELDLAPSTPIDTEGSVFL